MPACLAAASSSTLATPWSSSTATTATTPRRRSATRRAFRRTRVGPTACFAHPAASVTACGAAVTSRRERDPRQSRSPSQAHTCTAVSSTIAPACAARSSWSLDMEFKEPIEQLIRDPREFTREIPFPPASELRIYDTSLRDGEQMPGIAYTPEQKYEICRRLSDIGVHIMDVGFPAVSQDERQSLQLIMQGKRKGE